MIRVLIAVLAACAVVLCSAQDQLNDVRFVPTWGDHALVLGSAQRMADSSEVRIERLKFYVGIPFVTGNGTAHKAQYAYHLIDAEDSTTWTVAFPNHSDHFLVGVDSLTNVAGVLGGDLDPTKGMYWAWNSGYINLKIEGTCSASPYPKHEFELHLGGYAAPNATVQRVDLRTSNAPVIEVRVDVHAFLQHVDLASRCNVMSPGPEAVRLSRSAAAMFMVHAKH